MTDSQQRKLAAILAADIAGYSALMGADEDATVRDLKAHQGVILPMIAAHSGRVIDTAGDGVLAEFASAVNAVKCALAMQKTMAGRNSAVTPTRRMQFRIGINLGDVIYDEARVYGDGVNIAARLEGIAEPGGICISDKVHQEIRGKIDLAFRDLGSQTLKNIEGPVRVYRVEVSGESGATTYPPPQNPAQALPDKPSIAVLPFTNMSDGRDQEFFGDGLAEDVLTELSKFRWLFVIARNSSFTFRGGAVDIKQVSRELGVRYVLEGSVRRATGRVRVTGQLIDASTGMHIWAERYDRDPTDIFAVQDEITKAVAAAIGPAIVDAERQRAVRKPPENLGAWEAYQRGLWHLSKHEDAENTAARRLFERAVELDPHFASGYSALARTYLRSASTFFSLDYAEACRLGEQLSRKALELDDTDPEAYASLGLALFISGDHGGAIEEAEHALSLSANCAVALGVKGAAMIFSGQPSQGREVVRQFLKASPRDPAIPARQAQIAVSYYFDRDYELASEAARRAIRQYPKNVIAHRYLVASFGQLGRAVDAAQAIDAARSLVPSTLESFLERRPQVLRVDDYQHVVEGLRKAGC